MSSDNNQTANNTTRQNLYDRLQFLGHMSSTETAHFHQMAAAKLCMSVTDSKTISVLLQEGNMTAGELATRLSLTTGAITSLIDRMERIGLVKRQADPKDRRKVIVTLQTSRLAKGSAMYDSIGQSFLTLFASYTTEQLTFLIQYFEAAIELTKQETAKL